jgi:hypothetical protein
VTRQHVVATVAERGDIMQTPLYGSRMSIRLLAGRDTTTWRSVGRDV